MAPLIYILVLYIAGLGFFKFFFLKPGTLLPSANPGRLTKVRVLARN